MNYPLLKTELDKPAYSSLDAVAAANKLNEPTIVYYEEVATPELTNFMMNTGIYAKLLAVYRDHPNAQVRVVAESALDLAQSQIPFVNVQNPSIQQLLPALVQGQVWTQAEADSVINYAKRFKSKAEELFGESVTIADVKAARNWDIYLQLESERDALAQQLAAKDGQMADILAGLDVEVD